MQDQNESIRTLEQRVAALERMLAERQRQWRPRAGRRTYLLGIACLVTPLVAIAGSSVSQQQSAATPNVIRKVGSITQVSAPFEIVDGSGKAMLSVASEANLKALTSISNIGGLGGNLTVFSSAGIQMATIGVNTGGYGTLFANDAGGRPRAYVQGSGALVAYNDSGKQVAALLATSQQTGKVGIWNGEQSIADFTEGVGGSGVVTIYDKGHKALAMLTRAVGGAGGGLLQISNTTTPVANITVGPAGGGQLQLLDSGGNPTVEAGTTTYGLGIVRAGPNYKCAPGGAPALALGLPDCIMGRN